MSWFEEQLKYRREADDNVFADSLESIAGAIMGERLRMALDNEAAAASAIDEILRYYRCKSKNTELPSELKTLDQQMDYRLRPFGIMRRTVRLDKGWYRCAVGPMLGTLKDSGTAVALIPGKLFGYTMRDIHTGKTIRMSKKNEALLQEEGKPAAAAMAAQTESLRKRFSRRQIQKLTDILARYGAECNYNVGEGHVLGALAVEMEGVIA